MIGSRENKARSLATKFSVALITFAIGIVAAWFWTFTRTSPTPTPPQHPPVEVNYADADPGTLKRAIQDAKARGENTVELSVLGCGWDIGSLKTVLSRDTVVVADLLAKKTYADTWGLRTWYKFKIKETLLKHPPPRLAYPPFPNGLSEMLPIAEDEFLIQEANGQMEIDGVTVKQYSNGAWYHEDKTYLLFLWIDPSRRTAIRSGTDPLGVFLVDSDENFSPYVDKPYPLRTQLAKRFNNSVANLREALKK